MTQPNRSRAVKRRKLILTLVVFAAIFALIALWTRREWLGLALVEAMRDNGTARVERLLDKGASINTYCKGGPTPLHFAASRNKVEVAKVLLARGANVNSTQGGYTPLYLAVERGHVEMVELLLESGASVNASGLEKTPLQYAEEYGHKEVARILREHGAHN
jgi:ankyrin repeat protein